MLSIVLWHVSAFEINGPANEVTITDSELRDSDIGLYVSNSAENIAVFKTVIENMEKYGMDIYSTSNIERIELKSLSVCGTTDSADISFYKIGTVIDNIDVAGDLICDYAMEYNYDGNGNNRNITSEYCTASCPLTI